MRVTFDGCSANGRNHDETKERIRSLALVALNPVTGDLECVCSLRYWASRSSSGANVYATLTVKCGASGTSGYGVAPKGDLPLAFDRALTSAGIKVNDERRPVTQTAMTEAATLAAIARTLGYEKLLIV